MCHSVSYFVILPFSGAVFFTGFAQCHSRVKRRSGAPSPCVLYTEAMCRTQEPPLSDKTQLLSFCAPHLITSGDIFSRVVLPNYVLLPLLPWTDKHNMKLNERQACKEFYQYNGVEPRRRGEITLSPHYQRLIRVIGRGGAEERSLDVDKLRGAVGGELL